MKGKPLNQMLSEEEDLSASTPVWKRVTAFFTLGSLTILTGISIATILSVIAILLLFSLESGK